MKIVFRVFPMIAILILGGGCERAKEEPPIAPSPPAAPAYTLVYQAGEGGTLEGPERQSVAHGGDGSPVRAVPAEHHHFTGWSDGSSANPRTDTDVPADLEVTAEFAPDRYVLVYQAGEGGTLEGPERQSVTLGGDGSPVRAVPEKRYHFTGWSDGSSANPRTDADVTADLEVTAEFAPDRYVLVYQAGEGGAIEGPERQSVTHGGSGSQVTAVPEPGYRFERWSDGVTTANRTDAQVTGDRSVEAVFALRTYSLGGRVSGLAEGNRVVLQNQDGDDLAVTSNGPFSFPVELPGDSSYAVTVRTQPTSPNQTCTVRDGTGTITGEDVANVEVTCVHDTYVLGGSVSGLPRGDRVVLRNTAGEEIVVEADGEFSFARPLEDDSDYRVEVHRQPQKPNWYCQVENGSGTLSGEDVNDIRVVCSVKAVLRTRAGIGRIVLSWNSQDFSKVDFSLCRAREGIPAGGFAGCRKLEGGVLETGVTSPYTASGLTNDVPYWFQLEVRHAGGRASYSEVAVARSFGGLNDTGIDWCASTDANRSMDGTRAEKAAGCEDLATTHPGQDALYGRDALALVRKLAKTGHGSAGFDFTKLCGSGEAAGEGDCPSNPLLGDGPRNWACTRDNTTGLVWEVKTQSGLRSRDHTYSWYNPDETFNGGDPGLRNGGSCDGSGCDTHAFAAAVNARELCGASDWRLPTRRELLSIVDNGRVEPAIDTRFFPNASSTHYWSSSPYPDHTDSAWQVFFLHGEAYANEKNASNRIRLVRGRTVTFGLDNP